MMGGTSKKGVDVKSHDQMEIIVNHPRHTFAVRPSHLTYDTTSTK